MNVYILDGVGRLTHSWHPGGGLVVIAEDLEHAKLRVAATKDQSSWREDANLFVPTDEEWAEAKVLAVADDTEPSVHAHPDAGCC